MSLKRQIQFSKDADLFADLAKYKQAIQANRFPEMITEWKATVDLIEYEIDQRHLLANTVHNWNPQVLESTPF